jgi:cysteinyl-tRNA synthetase
VSIKVYNSLSREKEEFRPLSPPHVGMYVCGPTVYDYAHLGHAKSYVSFDVILRHLRYRGYKVRYVQNITDVGHLTDDADMGEDKVEARAKLERLEPMEIVEKYTRAYFEDMDALNVVRPNISPRASCHIPEMIEMIKILLDKGHAYEVAGSVYFDVSTFPGYGKLSGRTIEDQAEAVRIAYNPEKRHQADFALWKRADRGHIMRWPSPWGEGYPGWHIECSVMSMKYLGVTFDIHGGGLENIFPHHESEIAQSESATGQPFVRYWIHNNMVTVNGVKMGKSLGNFVTLRQAFSQYHPMVVRFFVLSSHYRSPVDYSDEALGAAASGLDRLLNSVRAVRTAIAEASDGEVHPAVLATLEEARHDVLEAMDDDFNSAVALAALFDLTREVNRWLDGAVPLTRASLKAIDEAYTLLGGDILGLITEDLSGLGAPVGSIEEELIRLLLDLRQQFRQARQFDRADEIRRRLADLGVIVEDTPTGSRWRRPVLRPARQA